MTVHVESVSSLDNKEALAMFNKLQVKVLEDFITLSQLMEKAGRKIIETALSEDAIKGTIEANKEEFYPDGNLFQE